MIEFMEASLPVVYSNLPAHREIVEGNIVGIEVNPERPTEIADALIALCDPVLGRSLGIEARKVAVERLNWSAEKMKLLELYDRILHA
jgi:glycosyltransferase involved in cell wall biosynthesis